jgi:hypothetical protein
MKVETVKTSPVKTPINIEEIRETHSHTIDVVMREGSILRSGMYKKFVNDHKSTAMI